MNKSMIVSSGLIVFIGLSSLVFAGNIEPPAGPNDPASAMYSIEAIYQRLSTGTNVARRTGAFTGPTGPPGSTGHDLNEVMAKAPSRDTNGVTTNRVPTGQTFWGLTSNEWGIRTGSGTRTLSANTNAVDAGYYAATNLSEVDTDLASTNIRMDVTIFGVTGAVYHAPVAKTGLTTSYGTNDDGFLQKGVPWPDPRFTTNVLDSGGNMTNVLVIDNLTGLMWTKNANLYVGTNWYAALTNCNECTVGGYTDWRLPNRKELASLLDLGTKSPALPDGHPFSDVQSAYYWTGTTCLSPSTGWKYAVSMGNGFVAGTDYGCAYYVWPVRGGL